MGTPVDYSDFKSNLTQTKPPENWTEALKALWHAAKGDWEASHDIAQEMPSSIGSWIHAYLHRQEGDEFNAGYWYRRAGKPFPKKSLEQELQEITEYVLTK